MDIFIERIIVKKKDFIDYSIIAGTVVLAFFLSLVAISLVPSSISVLVVLGLIYGAFRLIVSRNIEFEFAVTNGDLDIDRIVAQRKRKRIFSANCKEFDIVAKMSSEHFNNEAKAIANRIFAVADFKSPEVYFITLHYKGARTIVFFEPDQRMLGAFKTFIPKKVFE